MNALATLWAIVFAILAAISKYQGEPHVESLLLLVISVMWIVIGELADIHKSINAARHGGIK